MVECVFADRGPDELDVDARDRAGAYEQVPHLEGLTGTSPVLVAVGNNANPASTGQLFGELDRPALRASAASRDGAVLLECGDVLLPVGDVDRLAGGKRAL